MMLRVSVVDLTLQEPHQYIVLLFQRETERILGIWTGFREGPLVAWLAGDQPWVWEGRRRPLPYNFAANVLREAGVFLQDIQIVSESDDVYYAAARIRTSKGDFEVDARPSDAISLALALGRPIYADADLLRQDGWELAQVYPSGTHMGGNLAGIGDSLRQLWAGADSRVFSNSTLAAVPDQADSEAGPRWEEVRVVDVLADDGQMAAQVVLQRPDGGSVLPFRAAAWEAEMLAWMQAGSPWVFSHHRRPQTFQFLKNLFSFAGISLQRVRISGVISGVLYARVLFQCGENEFEVDARPIDALSMAAETGSPLFVHGEVWRLASLPPESVFPSRKAVGDGIRRILADLQAQAEQGTRPAGRSLLQRLGDFLRGG